MKKLILALSLSAPFISFAKDFTLSLNAGFSYNSTKTASSFQGKTQYNDAGVGTNPTFDIRIRKAIKPLLQIGAGVNVMPLSTSQKVVAPRLPGADVRSYNQTVHYANPMISPYVSVGSALKFKRHGVMAGIKAGPSFGIASGKETEFLPHDKDVDVYIDAASNGYNVGAYIDYVYQINRLGLGASFMPSFYSMSKGSTIKYLNIALPLSVSASIKI